MPQSTSHYDENPCREAMQTAFRKRPSDDSGNQMGHGIHQEGAAEKESIWCTDAFSAMIDLTYKFRVQPTLVLLEFADVGVTGW